MFKKPFSRKPSQLRPGLASGFYPEKKQVSEGGVERTWHKCRGFFTSKSFSRGRYNHILRSIHNHSQAIEGLDSSQFKEKCTELRISLHRRGLTEDLTAQAFALIREGAWRTLQMRHFDCQLIGGWIMVHGGVAEMETGEGKTLTATLAAGAAALAGIPVHIVTVNDYLVARDASAMAPLYKILGLSVSGVTEAMDAAARRIGYRSDIAYCTNKQIAFDYLRDRILLGGEQGRLKFKLEKLHNEHSRTDHLFLGGLCFAIIDEADSVLIDEARTPLILSREVASPEEEKTYIAALDLATLLEVDSDFDVNYKGRVVTLKKEGCRRLELLTHEMGGVWSGRRRSEELITQALSALYLYRRDHHYLVGDGRITIIDENTGRVMPDRSWERGLHQLIEMKEGCDVSGRREHLARLTYQRFFRRYLCLAGMSGTVSEVSREIWNVYGLPVKKVLTNKISKRCNEGQSFYASRDDKWKAVIACVLKKKTKGQPVLIGTRSVADSEVISELLHEKNIDHQVLNARQDSQESEIIARAGGFGIVTVATNMAGRGTDIPLERGVAEIGGLHVICTELNDAKRIDRQLSGRCGRQGDPGSYETIVSAEDQLFVHFLGVPGKAALYELLKKDSRLSRRLGLLILDLSQKSVERKNSAIRRDLLQMEEQIGKILAFTGSME
ncbi:MAG: preprotein translocase subunit SecA [Desulforhopalus sp.]|jgi:preprotein translocase subunit SecA